MNGEKERGHKDGGGGRDGARCNEVKRVITVTWKERQKDGQTDRQELVYMGMSPIWH